MFYFEFFNCLLLLFYDLLLFDILLHDIFSVFAIFENFDVPVYNFCLSFLHSTSCLQELDFLIILFFLIRLQSSELTSKNKFLFELFNCRRYFFCLSVFFKFGHKTIIELEWIIFTCTIFSLLYKMNLGIYLLCC